MKRITWETRLGTVIIAHSILVTLIIDNMLKLRKKRALMEKLSMVIGAFFSEMGSALLRELAACAPAAAPEVR